jgi:hypothetical protein
MECLTMMKAKGRTKMPAVEEVMTIVRRMTDAEREELFQLLEELDQKAWDKGRAQATRAFHSAGLTDGDIDEAVRKLRYEGRS